MTKTSHWRSGFQVLKHKAKRLKANVLIGDFALRWGSWRKRLFLDITQSFILLTQANHFFVVHKVSTGFISMHKVKIFRTFLGVQATVFSITHLCQLTSVDAYPTAQHDSRQKSKYLFNPFPLTYSWSCNSILKSILFFLQMIFLSFIMYLSQYIKF